MYSNKIIGTKDAITEAELKELEKDSQFSFPQAIKKHYLMYNGGYPERSLYVGDDGQEYVIDYFIPIKNDEERNLFETLRLLSDKKIIPSWLIPFADEICGDLFCFSVREKDRGSIYYYSHEFEYGDNPENHIVFLSQSLPDFINSLIEFDDEDGDD